MLTGHELKAERLPNTAHADAPARTELRLHWFLDGFRWNRAPGREERLPFMVRGTLAAEVSPELEGGELKLFLGGDGEQALAARVSQHAYCGPRAPWEEALISLIDPARFIKEFLRAEGMLSAWTKKTRGSSPGKCCTRDASK
jgi:hypothetical protein